MFEENVSGIIEPNQDLADEAILAELQTKDAEEKAGGKKKKVPKPKEASIIVKARNIKTQEDVMMLLKALASRGDYYKEFIPTIVEILEQLPEGIITSEAEEILLRNALKTMKMPEVEIVHPQIGIIIRQLYPTKKKEKEEED